MKLKQYAGHIVFLCALIITFFPFVPSHAALILGIGVGFLVGAPFGLKLTKKTQTYLLQGSVVALGAGMNIVQVLTLGAKSIPSTLLGIVSTFLVGSFLFKRFKLSRNLSILLSSGTAICGGSAIAAVAPAVKADSDDTSLALGVVFLLNSIALVIFPPLGHFFEFSEAVFGTWAALAIHDTSSVVGAATQYGAEALQVATTTKLVRALWIAPLTLAIVYFNNRKTSGSQARFPRFILFFLALSIVATLLRQQTGWVALLDSVYLLGKRGLVGAIFLIGTGFQIDSLKKMGWKVGVSASLLWFFSIGFAWVQVRYF